MGVPVVWFFAELTKRKCRESTIEKFVREKAAVRDRPTVVDLSRCGLRRLLLFFPQQNTSADEPDRLAEYDHAEAVHIEPDVS